MQPRGYWGTAVTIAGFTGFPFAIAQRFIFHRPMEVAVPVGLFFGVFFGLITAAFLRVERRQFVCMWSDELAGSFQTALAEIGYHPVTHSGPAMTFKPSAWAGFLAGQITVAPNRDGVTVVGPRMHVSKLSKRFSPMQPGRHVDPDIGRFSSETVAGSGLAKRSAGTASVRPVTSADAAIPAAIVADNAMIDPKIASRQERSMSSSSEDIVEQLVRLSKLRADNILSEEEFVELKKRLISSSKVTTTFGEVAPSSQPESSFIEPPIKELISSFPIVAGEVSEPSSSTTSETPASAPSATIAVPAVGNINVAHRNKSKTTAALLALLLGGLGAHRFYIGTWGWGLVYIALLVAGVVGNRPYLAAILGVCEGIRFIVMKPPIFDANYNYKAVSAFTF